MLGLPYCVKPTRVVATRWSATRAAVERRNAAHGVDDVLVEAGEKAESVLAGQAVLDRRHAALSARSCPLVPAPSSITADAAGLAARNAPALEHGHLEAALDQLVRGAHARHAAA